MSKKTDHPSSHFSCKEGFLGLPIEAENSIIKIPSLLG
jgi:hypothetical protein